MKVAPLYVQYTRPCAWTIVQRKLFPLRKLFTKPTDSHFYQNTSSCHPSHVIKNIPKGQCIRLRHICSQKSDYLLNSEILCKKIIERGFHEKELKKTIKQVPKMDRN